MNKEEALKWFKHEVDAHEGKILAHIFRRYGLEGEARYWRLIGMLAKNFPPKKGWFTVDLGVVQNRLRQKKIDDCVAYMEHLAAYKPTLGTLKDKDYPFIFEHSETIGRIKYDKISEIKDNHTRNLQVTDKRLASDLALDKKKNKNKKREDTPPTPEGESSPSAMKKKPNAVVVANEILGLLRAHPPGTDLVPLASDFARNVFFKHSPVTLRNATEFELHQLVREALKEGA